MDVRISLSFPHLVILIVSIGVLPFLHPSYLLTSPLYILHLPHHFDLLSLLSLPHPSPSLLLTLYSPPSLLPLLHPVSSYLLTSPASLLPSYISLFRIPQPSYYLPFPYPLSLSHHPLSHIPHPLSLFLLPHPVSLIPHPSFPPPADREISAVEGVSGSTTISLAVPEALVGNILGKNVRTYINCLKIRFTKYILFFVSNLIDSMHKMRKHKSRQFLFLQFFILFFFLHGCAHYSYSFHHNPIQNLASFNYISIFNILHNDTVFCCILHYCSCFCF